MIHDDQILKQMAERSLANGIEYLDRAETALARLLTLNENRFHMPAEVGSVASKINEAYNLAWAMRRFPIFDTSALAQMKKMTVRGEVAQSGYNSGSQDKTEYLELDVWVPLYAMSQVGQAGFMRSGEDYEQVKWSPESEAFIYEVKLDQNCIKENRDEVARKRTDKTKYGSVSISTKPPVVPAGVRRILSGNSARFDVVALVWNAQWDATMKTGEAMTLGKLGGWWFVVARFFPTDIDAYVSTDLTNKGGK